MDSEIKLSMEIQDIVSEVQNSRKVVDTLSSLLDEVFQSLSTIFDVFNVSSFEAYAYIHTHTIYIYIRYTLDIYTVDLVYTFLYMCFTSCIHLKA